MTWRLVRNVDGQHGTHMLTDGQTRLSIWTGEVNDEALNKLEDQLGGKYNLAIRRRTIEQLSKGERAIYDAVDTIEEMGADIRLTDAVVLLQEAREAVADYVDGVNPNKRRIVNVEDPEA